MTRASSSFKPGIGLGLDAGDFRFERASRGFFGLLTGFDLGALAEQLDFLLRVFVRAARFGGFLAQPLELGEQAGFRFGAYARDFGLERAGGFLIGGVAGFLAIARVVVVPGLLLEPRALGLFTHAREFGVQPGIGFLAHALHFFLELVGRGFLRGHAGFLRGQLAQRLGFELRLRLRETRFGGFLAESIELAAKTGFGLFADACDLALEGAGGGFVRRLARFLCRDVALTIGLALGLLLRAAGLFGFERGCVRARC